MSAMCQQRTLLNDTLETTPTGRLMFNMLGAIAQFERELIRERAETVAQVAREEDIQHL
jgi:DNA invertase Pin-like site-specific DNA recombinase